MAIIPSSTKRSDGATPGNKLQRGPSTLVGRHRCGVVPVHVDLDQLSVRSGWRSSRRARNAQMALRRAINSSVARAHSSGATAAVWYPSTSILTSSASDRDGDHPVEHETLRWRYAGQ